jgi:phosphatidylglycerophosphate synthase
LLPDLVTDARYNVPNALSLSRLLGVPVLFLLLERDQRGWFIALYALLGLTDYLDGKLARAWGQTSAFGSMLDSVADVAYYLSTAYFVLRLFPTYVEPNIPYVIACVLGFAALVVVSLLRVGKPVLPHTHLSRVAGVLAVLAVFASFLMDTTYVFRGVILLYTIAFLEQIAMVALYGDIPPDTRTTLWLRGRTR